MRVSLAFSSASMGAAMEIGGVKPYCLVGGAAMVSISKYSKFEGWPESSSP
jgi:hypothetical protein